MKGSIRYDEPMSRHTTFRIGGPADRFVVPSGIRGLQSLLQEFPADEKITMVGAGSNLLVSDKGIRGTVVHTGGLDWIRVRENRAWVGAGVLLPGLLWKLARRGFGGLECLTGIPGSLGGAIRMNAGTREGSIADRLVSVTLIRRSGEREKRNAGELVFGYRYMELPEDAWIVGAWLEVEPMDPREIEQKMRDRLNERHRTQPVEFPCAGSIFKNPPGHFAGQLIEAAGMKGERVGDAEVSVLHANYIINRGRASASDVLALIRKIREKVEQTSGVSLELEIRVLGELA
ncbi:MAG: UDP-N-acetylmuramate dehydrogenase [bacterium]